ncbi:MAG: hypothetical protein IPO67_15480 [Deltaproteobacteria bacterium]|nr:hypothetical protein [Deltaproteobacteria bacterium]MBK9646527.1 hypothetical protein [Deltaproteobacteria bacterium]
MDDERALLGHLPSEFLTWLWFASERDGGTFQLGDEVGAVDVWVDDRIAFRSQEEDKPRTVLTGENPSGTPEARAALAGGRVVRELRLAIRKEDREYSVSVRGAFFDLQGAKLPGLVKAGQEEMLYERMYLYEELMFIVGGLLRKFAIERTDPAWGDTTLRAMRRWVATPPSPGGRDDDFGGGPVDDELG